MRGEIRDRRAIRQDWPAFATTGVPATLAARGAPRGIMQVAAALPRALLAGFGYRPTADPSSRGSKKVDCFCHGGSAVRSGNHRDLRLVRREKEFLDHEAAPIRGVGMGLPD